MLTAFDRSKCKGYDDFWKQFNTLCAETPNKKLTCQRIRENQELFLEYQQKCLNQYDPTVQQAIEFAGDVIRELSKRGCEAYDLGYIDQQIRLLRKEVDELARR